MATLAELSELRAALQFGQDFLVVHYACEDFNKAKQRPAAVACIAVAGLGEGSSRAFSLADAPPDVEGDDREKDLLRRFFEFLSAKSDTRLLHWNMNTSAYGFEDLALRYRWLTSEEPPYKPVASRMHDVDALVAAQFGQSFVAHPKLPNLIALNGMHRRHYLSGPEEAQKFEDDDIGAVRSSATEKARFIGWIFERLVAGKLKTAGSAGSVDFAGTKLDAVAVAVELGGRFRYVERALCNRHGSRTTIQIVDEYDAQDLYRALLRVFFDDVRDEVWTPSYAGSAGSRIDLVLPDFALAIELKYARPSMSDKDVGDQLIIDRDRYKRETSIQHLLCLVFDHNGQLHNPRGLEKDLKRAVSEEGMAVSVHIYDR